jgi:hypothetical protein
MPRNPYRAAVPAIALALLAAGCGSSAPPPFRVTGEMDVTDASPAADSDGCQFAADDGYSDITQGAQVTVSAGGRVLAVGELQEGTEPGDSGTCDFPFTVSGVPGGHSLYGVQVSHRGTLYYSRAQLRAGITMTLGG